MFYIAGKSYASNIQGPAARSNTPVGCDRAAKKTWIRQFLDKGQTSGRKQARGAAAMFVIVLVTCFLANWGLKQMALSSKSHEHQSASSAFCPLQSTEDAKAAKQEGEAGLLEQFFCPIVELPGFHGLLIPE